MVLPGGPGLGSVAVYRGFRERARRAGLDVVMVEHRGVGLSRRDRHGADLPVSAVTVEQVVEDVVAVLDAEGIDRAVVVGSSYGSYPAQGLAVSHPDRVAALVLDSTILTTEDHHAVRAHARSLLWAGDDPATAHLARKIRTLVERDGADPLGLGRTIRVLYEFGGPQLLEQYLDQRVTGRARLTTRTLDAVGTRELSTTVPYVMEFALVGAMAFRELDYGPEPDGMIFDPAFDMAGIRDRFPAYAGEPFDLVSQSSAFPRPVVVVSGDRDLRTPRPIAERTAALVPDGVLVPLHGAGHSALDTRDRALIEILRAVVDGRHRELGARAPHLSALPRSGSGSHRLDTVIRGLLAVDRTGVPAIGGTLLDRARG